MLAVSCSVPEGGLTDPPGKLPRVSSLRIECLPASVRAVFPSVSDARSLFPTGLTRVGHRAQWQPGLLEAVPAAPTLQAGSSLSLGLMERSGLACRWLALEANWGEEELHVRMSASLGEVVFPSAWQRAWRVVEWSAGGVLTYSGENSSLRNGRPGMHKT